VIVEEHNRLELSPVLTNRNAVHKHIAVAADDHLLRGRVVPGGAIRTEKSQERIAEMWVCAVAIGGGSDWK
jgi:hypothetical protein